MVYFLGGAPTAHFRREDVADRLLIIHVERFEKFVSANQLDADIERNRDALMTEVVSYLQRIVAELDRQKDVHIPTTFRMADFAEFAIKIGLEFGVRPEEVEQILNDLTDVQLEFTSEDEPLLLHIDGWLGDGKNIAKWVSTKELFEQLHGRWTVTRAGTFPWPNQRQLGQQITSLRATLETHYDFDEQKKHAGARHVRFNKSRAEGDVATAVVSSWFAPATPPGGNSTRIQ